MKHLKVALILSLVTYLTFSVNPLYADVKEDIQTLTEENELLKARVRELEDYVNKMYNEFTQFSSGIQQDLINYKEDVRTSLEEYSRDLQSSIEHQLKLIDDSVVILNLASKGYRKIVTNSGVFLVSINKVERVLNGYRLFFHIGNPNFASYQGVKMKVRWGPNFNAQGTQTYREWRSILVGAEFTYNGKLEQGTWTEIAVDLAPASTNELKHIELGLELDAIQLNLKKPKPIQ